MFICRTTTYFRVDDTPYFTFRLVQVAIWKNWVALRHQLESQHRLTVTLQKREQQVLHVWKCSRPEPDQARIHQAPGIKTTPSGIKKSIV